MDQAEASAGLGRFLQDNQAAHDALINDPFAQQFILPSDIEYVTIDVGGAQMQAQRIKAASLKRVLEDIARALGATAKEVIDTICDPDGFDYCKLRQIMSDASLLLEALQKAGWVALAGTAAVSAGMAAGGFLAWLSLALTLRALDEICGCGKSPAAARRIPAGI